MEMGRERPVVPGRTAFLVVDVQNGTLEPEDASRRPEFHQAATGRVVPNLRRLIGACRAARVEVI